MKAPFRVLLLVGGLVSAVIGTQAPRPASAIPVPNVLWGFQDSVAVCPAGDSLVGLSGASHPSKLRIPIFYFDNADNPRVGVPPESIYVTVSNGAGNVVEKDMAAHIFADDSTNSLGMARVTISSFSGSGLLNVFMYVSGVYQGSLTAHVRTVDNNADGRVTGGDSTSYADINYDGATNSSDGHMSALHLAHWNRNALHGTLVRRTNLCETCAAESTGTMGESEISWSPDNKKIAFTVHTGAVVDGEAPCAVFIVPSSPSDGDTLTQFTFPDSSLHDYDPAWSPLGYEIVFDRDDRRILRRGIPGIASNTALILVTASGDMNLSGDVTPGVSPDGKWAAFSRRDGGPRHLYKVPIGGGTPTQLTNETDGVDFYPQWSSDGVWITFDRQNGGSDQPHHVFKIKANGDSVQAVFDAPSGDDAATPAYSPDNAIVLFGSGTHGSSVRDVSTRTLDPLSPSKPAIPNYDDPAFSIVGPDPVLSPRLSADGTRLALRSKQVWAARRNMNLPPVIASVSGHTITHQTPYFDITQGQDTTLTLTVSRSDPTSDALADSACFLRPDLWMSWTPSSQTFSWPVGDSPVGSYTVKFATSDPSGGTDYALARILVRDITHPAVITDIDAQPDLNTDNKWNLSWTATADDSNYSGTEQASQYDIRTYGGADHLVELELGDSNPGRRTDPRLAWQHRHVEHHRIGSDLR